MQSLRRDCSPRNVLYFSFKVAWECFKFNFAEAYSETGWTPKMELFAKIVNCFKPLTIFAKSSILDVRVGCVYASNLDWLGDLYKDTILLFFCWFLIQNKYTSVNNKCLVFSRIVNFYSRHSWHPTWYYMDGLIKLSHILVFFQLDTIR